MSMLERRLLFVAVFLYKELAIGDHIKIIYVPVKEREKKGKGSRGKRKGRKNERRKIKTGNLI